MTDSKFIGYVRVSTTEQHLDLQIQALKEAGVEGDFLFQDVASGRTMEKRQGLRHALMACRPGDTLLVWKLDRLGRNTAELISTVDRLKERGVNFRSLTQSEIDTTKMDTATGTLIFSLFAALGQFESDQISERTRAGNAAARQKALDAGKEWGRPSFETLYIKTGKVEAFKAARAEGMTIKDALKVAGGNKPIPPATYQKWKDVFNEEPIDDIGADTEEGWSDATF